ncbi:MAG: hypothetical protein IPL27_20065 [Lewinellaceae bacterium]|nr:hypothetical protein [Lewinellaceae bacterium]
MVADLVEEMTTLRPATGLFFKSMDEEDLGETGRSWKSDMSVLADGLYDFEASAASFRDFAGAVFADAVVWPDLSYIWLFPQLRSPDFCSKTQVLR